MLEVMPVNKKDFWQDNVAMPLLSFTTFMLLAGKQ